MATILFLNRLDDRWMESVQRLKREFPHVEMITYEEAENPRDLLPQADAVVTGYLSREEVRKASRLKAIFVPFAGVNMLPIEDIRQRSIIVSNAHGNAKYVAEHALTLALALLGRVVEYHEDLKKGIWHGFAVGNTSEDKWTTLFEKRCAVLGLGKIGRELAKLLKAFGCYVTGFKKTPSKKSIPNVDEITTDLEKAIENAKVVFVTLPLTPETEGLIDSNILSKMRGKYLVNVGRGHVIDEEALYKALKEGILAGAAIDVWYQYPESPNHAVLPSRYPIHTFKNVVISPHVSGIVEEAMQANMEETLENIRSWLITGEPLNKVDLGRMY